MEPMPPTVKLLARPILQDAQESAMKEQETLVATLKCVADSNALEGTQQVAPTGMVDCSLTQAMDAAGRLLPLEHNGSSRPCS